MPLLEIKNVTRRFGDFIAADNISLSVEAGEFFTLLGALPAARGAPLHARSGRRTAPPQK